MSTLLQSLAAGFDGDDARRGLLDAALHDGLPGPRSEAWKYTSLRQLERRGFAVAADDLAAVDPALLADIPAPRLVFVNGRHAAALSDLSGLPAGVALGPLSTAGDMPPTAPGTAGSRLQRAEDVFARLNTALAREGAVVRVAEGVDVEQPLHLVFIAARAEADTAWHLHHRVELLRGAALQLVEHHLQADAASSHLANTLTHVHVAEGATLAHARVQADAAGHTALLRTEAVLAGDATYRRVDLELGAALARHELNVRLEGDNARLTANGVLLGNGRRHIDTRLGIEHAGRDTGAELIWRGVATDRSRVVFHGGINILAGADGTDARLSNKNLLLSANAEIDTQPVLVIDADEVQAAHGATVGQLDQQALFYLRSRGIPKDRAQALLSAAFCHEPLGALDGAAAEVLAAHLDRALSASGVA